ncbi:Non-specific serine/threonine protein kinase [Desulfatibacillum aliphaticivorans]|uniref:Non-specific serine/threonine protein kinase n=1 Tax=Desulfatibacillum aliphaticivorans TaxID=218208 RepID=B8FL84_DESAL|nr:DEAD/DEAH box helicase [Desulfatibacillum aliphaticivorans]ACL04719.1 Non-specific serine/threonine protein kinase [Desulfatibacillum aliphaticivorans]
MSTLALSPSGRLLLQESGDDWPLPESWIKKAPEAFASSQAQGLFTLAAIRPDGPVPPVFAFWKDFSSQYLTLLCRIPESMEAAMPAIAPPDDGRLNDLIASAPPMPGGEYLSKQVLQAMWNDLDQWAREDIQAKGEGLNPWLKANAPLWRQVGRVCFHIAENKKDPDYPFALLATYAPRLSAGGGVQYRPLGKALQEYAGERNKQALVRLLEPVHQASKRVEFVRELVETGDIYHPLALTAQEAYMLLQNTPDLEESGLLVRLPDWWKRRPRPRVSVTVGEKRKSVLGLNAMLDFRVDLSLEGQKLTQDEWRRLMESEDGLVLIKGQWVEVDRDKLAQTLDHWKQVEAQAGKNGISFIEGMRLLAGAPADLKPEDMDREDGEWSHVDAGKWLSKALADLRDPQGLTIPGRGSGFQGELRQYQETGRNWLWFLSQLGLGACLADDMGLGKTIQVLSLLTSLKAGKGLSKPALLVLPASLLANWKSEKERFAPGLNAVFVHPSEADKTTMEQMRSAPAEHLDGADMVLTTYGMLMRQSWLLDVDWGLAILDEAQAIKNPATKQTRTVKKLKADARIALTGTPVENRLTDLWSLFDFLCPGLLGSSARFKKFSKGLEKRSSDRYRPLRNLVSPYVLRRLKTDKSIIADLPDKTEVKAYCGLAKKQAALYAKSVQELAKSIETAEGIERRGIVLSFLMRFKQICNHPSQYIGDGEYSPNKSGKFLRLKEICEEIASRQEKALIFTQFREMTDPLAAYLGEIFGREGLILHGGTPVKKRKNLVDVFQRDDGPPFFVLSLKAGGTGLNLTNASHVIHFDRWWNPAVENQATDRAFRIGQHKNVLVHKFVCRGTLEEKIDALIEEKIGLAEGVLKAGGEAVLTEMSDEDLLKIVALDINQAGL